MNSIPKSEARRWAKKQRSSICRGMQLELNTVLTEIVTPWLLDQIPVTTDDWIAVYMATEAEPSLDVLCQCLHQLGRPLGLPRMTQPHNTDGIASTAELDWHRYIPPPEVDTGMIKTTRLIQHPWGLWEPDPNEPRWMKPPGVVLLPCLAMDRQGNRLGYGKGFYDRAIHHWQVSSHSTPLLISVCWNLCQLPKTQCLETDSWDIPVHYTVCEAGLIPHVRGQLLNVE